MKCTPKDDELERYFYTVDEQGSTTLITNNSANISNEYYYDSFGNIIESREDIHNRITYTGQQFDSYTQQYYLRARFYNPAIGRFTQEDIYRSDGLNLYAYCKNNPVGYYDPSGYVCDGKKTPLNIERDTEINHNNLDLIKDLLKNGRKTADGKNIVNQIDDSTKVIFRMDVGDNAHSIGSYGYLEPINHINVEIQRKSASGKWSTKWDFHIILDENGNVVESFATGIWTKK